MEKCPDDKPPEIYQLLSKCWKILCTDFPHWDNALQHFYCSLTARHQYGILSNKQPDEHQLLLFYLLIKIRIRQIEYSLKRVFIFGKLNAETFYEQDFPICQLYMFLFLLDSFCSQFLLSNFCQT